MTDAGGEYDAHRILRPYVEYPQPKPNESPRERAVRLCEWAKNNLAYSAMYWRLQCFWWRFSDLMFKGDHHPSRLDFGFVGEDALILSADPESISLQSIRPDLPVFNEFKDAILNEGSRLNLSDFEPTVQASGEDPTYDQREGARIATAALRQSLKDMRWDAKRRTIAQNLPQHGGAWIWSWWDQTMEETVKVAASEQCCACPSCDTMYAGPPPDQQPDETAPLGTCTNCEMHRGMRPPTEDDISMRMEGMDQFQRAQPEMLDQAMHAEVEDDLPGGPSLEPRVPVDAELEQVDPYGRPLGQEVPLGRWVMEVPAPYDVFEEDLGIGHAGSTVRDVTRSTVRTLDWCRARYPNARANDPATGKPVLRPESSTILREFHGMTSAAMAGVEDMVWRNHTRVITRIKQPWYEEMVDPQTGQGTGRWEMNRGRVVTVANGVVLEDGPLMVDGPDGKPFPRVAAFYVAHDVSPGQEERLGCGLGRTLVDPQRCINFSVLMDLETQDAGSPKWLAEYGTNLSYNREGSGTGLPVVRWRQNEATTALGAEGVPKLLSSISEAVKWGAASEFARSFMQRAARLTETEAGSATPGVTAAKAYEIFREESGATRRPRVGGMATVFEQAFRHGLQLTQHYVREPRHAWTKTDAGAEFELEWQGLDFRGQLNVRIEIEGRAESQVLRQEQLEALVGRNLVDMEDPRQRRILAKEMGAPVELYQGENLQTAAAEREFLEFTRGVDPLKGMFEFGPTPVRDPGLDVDELHAEQHAVDCHGYKWRWLEQQAGWDEALKAMGQWEAVVSQTLQQGGGTPSLMWPNTQDWLIQLWTVLIQQNNPELLSGQTGGMLQGMLAFRAHLEAHRIAVQGASLQQAAAQAPVQQPVSTEGSQ